MGHGTFHDTAAAHSYASCGTGYGSICKGFTGEISENVPPQLWMSKMSAKRKMSNWIFEVVKLDYNNNKGKRGDLNEGKVKVE